MVTRITIANQFILTFLVKRLKLFQLKEIHKFKMIARILFALAVGLTFTNAASLTDDVLTCYNCGYLQLTNGTRIPLKEEYGDIPFCGDFASDEGMTIPAMIVSSSQKIYYTLEQPFRLIIISIHQFQFYLDKRLKKLAYHCMKLQKLS